MKPTIPTRSDAMIPFPGGPNALLSRILWSWDCEMWHTKVARSSPDWLSAFWRVLGGQLVAPAKSCRLRSLFVEKSRLLTLWGTRNITKIDTNLGAFRNSREKNHFGRKTFRNVKECKKKRKVWRSECRKRLWNSTTEARSDDWSANFMRKSLSPRVGGRVP